MKENERSRLGGITGRSLTEQAYEIIKEAIVSLKFKPLFIKDYEKILEALKKREPEEAERALLAI